MAHKVVIVGGGFGGLYAAKALRRAPLKVTLVDHRNFHLFQPLLYQVATGQLSPAEIAYPLRASLQRQKNTRVLLAEALDFDPSGRVLILSGGAKLPYDSLVIAAGARNSYFGNDAWAEHACALKTIEDATRIRHKILYAFEAAENEPDPEKRQAWLTFAVVGGGPTGVELAGALGEIANDALKGDFRSIRPEEARIILLEGAPRILPPFEADLSAKAERSLIGLGVRARTGVRVTGIDATGVWLESPAGKEHIEARTVLWAAGVRGAEFGAKVAARTGAQLDRAGRVPVAPDCSVRGYPDVFVIGDLATLTDAAGKPVPGVCPAAMQQGEYVARVIQARLHGRTTPPFRYHNKGALAVIGRAAAVAQFETFRFSGLLAWLLWLFVHLMYLVNFQNRVLVFLRWGFSYFTYNRGARLITGPPDAAGEERPAAASGRRSP